MDISTMKVKRVPWKSTQEWIDVKNKVVTEDHVELNRAYELIHMWKSRCANLPAHVECTLGILQVLINDDRCDCFRRCFYDKECDLQLRYSTALLRFVNHVSASTCLQGDTLYLVAHKQNIPDWVVNLRHDIAHSANLPPLPLLKASILLAKQWLIENYWEPVEEDIMCVDGSTMGVASNIEPGFVQTFVRDAINAWIICRPNPSKSKTITDLNEGEWECILKFVGRVADYKLIRNEPVVQRIQPLLETYKKDRHQLISKKNRLFKLHKNILEILNILYKKKNEKLNNSFLESLVQVGFLKSAGNDLKEWEPLIHIFHAVDSLQVLLNFLFDKLCSTAAEEALFAECWLRVLAPSLENLRIRWKQSNQGKYTEDIADANDEIELLLPLRQPPSFGVNKLQQCLLNPTSSSYTVLIHYIKFIRPAIPKYTRSVMKELMKIYTGDPIVETTLNANNSPEVEIHSIADLKTHDVYNKTVTTESRDRWLLATEDIETWRCCSIGMFPNQLDLNWQLPSMRWRDASSRKRKADDEVIY